jgi:two-component system, LytTR family, sensor kinase
MRGLPRRRRERRAHYGTAADRATFRTLHTAGLAAPALREGLTGTSAERSVRHLRSLLDAPAVALADESSLLAWDGAGVHHGGQAAKLAVGAAEHGATMVFARRDLPCAEPGCIIRSAVVCPLFVDNRMVGALEVFSTKPTAALVTAADEVAKWVSGQLSLAELDASRTRLIEAEVRALRAQISPHFIYNSLGAIASFVRTDPCRARHLLLDFAEFTRYSFRTHGAFTTLADELRSIEQYLVLERARFGDRLHVTLRIAPEVLPVMLPYLCVQPLVENAVRHGLEGREAGGSVVITAQDRGRECVLTIEDDGQGADPAVVRRALAGRQTGSTALGNVDERLRRAFGEDFGLVVETAPGAGTKVELRLPKFSPGVHER